MMTSERYERFGAAIVDRNNGDAIILAVTGTVDGSPPDQFAERLCDMMNGMERKPRDVR